MQRPDTVLVSEHPKMNKTNNLCLRVQDLIIRQKLLTSLSLGLLLCNMGTIYLGREGKLSEILCKRLVFLQALNTITRHKRFYFT